MWGRCCGVVRLSTHVGPAHACRQAQLLLLRQCYVLWDWGWKRVQQTGLTLFYPCLPGDVGLAEVERGLLGTESPLELTQSPDSGTFPCYLLVPGTYQHYNSQREHSSF